MELKQTFTYSLSNMNLMMSVIDSLMSAGKFWEEWNTRLNNYSVEITDFTIMSLP